MATNATIPMFIRIEFIDSGPVLGYWDDSMTFLMIFTACCIAITLASITILEFLNPDQDTGGKVYATCELDLPGGSYNIWYIWITLIITLAAIQPLTSPLNQHIEEEQVMSSIIIKENEMLMIIFFDPEPSQGIDETLVLSSIKIKENMMPTLSSHLQPNQQAVDGNSVVTSSSTVIKGKMMQTFFSHLQPWVHHQFIVFCMYAFSGSLSAVLLHNKPKMGKFFRFCQYYSQLSMASAGFILLYAALSSTIPSLLPYQQTTFTMVNNPGLIIPLLVIFLWSAFMIKHRRALLSKLNLTFNSPSNALNVISI